MPPRKAPGDAPDLASASEFKLGDKIGNYEIVQPPGLLDSDGIASPLSDKGATSTVYLVKQSIGPDAQIARVLKLFAPKEKVKNRNKAAGHSYGAGNFLSEISLLAKLTHQNLVKIIDAGSYRDQLYYVMEFIDGSTLEDLFQPAHPLHASVKARTQTDPFMVIRIARQACASLIYMHSQNQYHFDVAPKNIFIKQIDARFHVVLGDLGVSRHVPPTTALEPERIIFVAGTKRYTPPELLPYLNTEVTDKFLVGHAARWDVYALAQVIDEMIDEWGLTTHRGLRALRILLKKTRSQPSANSAEKFSEELERLLPVNVVTAAVPELSSDAAGEALYVNIPLYRVPITRRVRAIINHPEFTRLQHVPQMFLVRSAFPGGIHSMYEHALGTFALTQRILLRLLASPPFRAEFSRKELEMTLVVSLLTRAANFTFDRVIYECCDIDKASLMKDRLSHRWPEHPNLFGQEINQQFPGVDLERAIAILTTPDRACLSPYEKLVHSLVRSSIDVRVLDFLPRDSYHTGIPVGTGVDISNIIQNMVWNEGDDSIGVRRGGVFDLENLFCARYWMFTRIYWNTPVRSIAAMLRFIIYRLTGDGGLNPAPLIRKLFSLDESGALTVLKSEWESAVNNEDRAAPILDLLGRGRPRVYNLVLEYFERNWRGMERARAECMTVDAVEQLGKDFLGATAMRTELKSSDVLFDIPVERGLKLGQDISVEIDRGTFKQAEEASDIIRILPKTFEETAVRLRVYCNPDFDEQKRNRIREEAKRFLASRFGA